MNLTLALKVFISAALIASLLDMVFLRQLKRYSDTFTREEFTRGNLNWIANVPLIRQILGPDTVAFMKSRTLWFPLPEILFAGLAVANLYTHDLSGAFFHNMIYIYYALLLSIIALNTADFLVPYSVVLQSIVLGLLISVLHKDIGIGGALAGMALNGGVFLLIFLGGILYARLTQLGFYGLGFGNVMAAAVVGAFCGWRLGLVAIMTGIFLGAVGAMVFLAAGALRQRQNYLRTPLPYPQYIYLGGIIALTVPSIL